MIRTLYYIAGSQVNPPKNWMELGIELNYGKDQFPQAGTITITNFDWVRENYDLLEQYIEDGKTGGVGIFEAPPFRIDVTDGTTTKTVFDGYLDLTSRLTVKDRIRLTAKVTSHATVDWVSDADSFTFEYLDRIAYTDDSRTTVASPLPAGAITNDYYKFIPYVNSGVPNYEQAALATLMAFEVGKALADDVNKLYNLCAQIIANWSDIEIAEVLEIIIEVLYLIALAATLVKLVEDIVKYIISPVKYHACMYVRDLMKKGCEYLNMNFSSPIWEVGSPYYNEVILPEKFYNAPSSTDSSIFGFLIPDHNEQIGYYKGTFGQLLDKLKAKYNAKIVITTTAGVTTLNFIRKDKNALAPVYTLPPVYQPTYTYNTDELQANYLIEYQTDSTDTNTFNNYSGTIYQVITQPRVVNYQPYVMMKNLVTVDIGFARASRKTSLTTPEKILSDLARKLSHTISDLTNIMSPLKTMFDSLGSGDTAFFSMPIMHPFHHLFSRFTSFFHATPLELFAGLMTGTSFFALIGDGLLLLFTTIEASINLTDRKGMLLLSSDHFSVAKIFILDENPDYKLNRININNDDLESAKAVWDYSHYVNSFLPTSLNPAYLDRPTGNQFKIKNIPAITFDWDDFLNVFQNNRIYDAYGKIAIIETLKFNPYKETAEMKVRFGEVYTLNLQETFLNPTGK